jgi:hypothetical protein
VLLSRLPLWRPQEWFSGAKNNKNKVVVIAEFDELEHTNVPETK